MTNKAPYCAFWWLTITVLSRLQIKICPKGLHNFALYILIFDFLFPFSLFPCPFSLTPNVILHKYLRLYNCRDTFTNVMSALQIHLFLQNEPNFRKSQMSLSVLLIGDYEQMDTWSIRKNEPKTNPNEPKTNPILANKTTIRTQFKPKQTQSQYVCPPGSTKEWKLDFWLSNLFDLQICLNRPKYSEIHNLIAWSVMKRNCRCRRIRTISHRFVELKGINHGN